MIDSLTPVVFDYHNEYGNVVIKGSDLSIALEKMIIKSTDIGK